jgi:hypothetical protein
MKKSLIVLIALIVLLGMGCKSLLPTDDARPKNPWTNYLDAHEAFNKIVVHQTTVADLKSMGYDPTNSPNMKILTYLDIIQRFLPNQSVTKSDLPPDVRYCLEARDGCRGYELVLDSTHQKRCGNLPLDAFGFSKKTHVTGWKFTALLIVQNDIVTYKLASGEPNIDRMESKVKPLGPFQELEGLVTKIPIP